MNNLLTEKALRELLKEKGDLLISCYVNTIEKGNPKKNKVKFKDLIGRAKINLENLGYSPQKTKEILDHAYRLEQDDDLWLRQKKGFAAFFNDESRYFMIDSDVPNLLLIGNRYHLKPLIRFKQHDNPFWILYLDKSEAELYRASRQYIRKMKPKELPEGLNEVMQFQDSNERAVQFHTKTRHRVDQRPAVHHGQGEPQRYEEQALRKYLNELNNAVVEQIKPYGEPLIIAGEQNLHAKFRKTNSYQHLVQEGIVKNINSGRQQKLHDSALKILLPQWKKKQQKTIDEFNTNKKDGLTSVDTNQIINAAYSGNIKTLLVKRGINIWGVYNPSTGVVQVHDEQTLESVDLLSVAVEECYKRDKDVCFLDPEDFPADSDIAAILYK